MTKQKVLALGIGMVLVCILTYTRFVGLDWGLPYPMHPDERNMVISILEMRCNEFPSSSCMHPHFFAYGQVPLYLGYLLGSLINILQGSTPPLTLEQVTLALRIMSATSSVLLSLVLYKTIKVFVHLRKGDAVVAFLMVTFVPAFIQFSHFGTTESFLMLFVSIIFYWSLRFLERTIRLRSYFTFLGVLLGIALSTKVSALSFGVIPATAIMLSLTKVRSRIYTAMVFFGSIKTLLLMIAVFLISSPFTLIDFPEFIHSMNYESAVGIGTYKAFYTRQFEYTIPVVFQMIKVFPYTLGFPVAVLALIGLLILPWKRKYVLLRVSIIALFLPQALLYAKWSRFLAPVFPLLVLVATAMVIIFFQTLSQWGKKQYRWIINAGYVLATSIVIIPGVAYMTIYQTPDVRFVASKWIYENIDPSSIILSETANVVDIPMPNSLVSDNSAYLNRKQPISFNFYELDNDPLEEKWKTHLNEADYIFIPSRRIFANHTCYQGFRETIIGPVEQEIISVYNQTRCSELQTFYPLLTEHYDNLFSEGSPFRQIASFSSFPRIEFFGHTFIAFDDEMAEETWTVFDHPVIRIFERVK